MRRKAGLAVLKPAVVLIVASLHGWSMGAAPARLPFRENFESGILAPCWTTGGTSQFRIQVTNTFQPHGGAFHVLLDDRISDGVYSRNELTLQLDASGYTNLVLRYWVKGFSEEPHGPPSSPFASADFDGVAVSLTGDLWQEVQTWRNLTNDYFELTAPLDLAMRQRGWAYGTNLLLRFCQFDNQAIPGDGIALDDIAVTGNLPPMAERRIVTVAEDSQVAIELPGTDPEGNALRGTILSLPGSGRLFQLTNGVAGEAITNVPATLAEGRTVLYVTSPNRSGPNLATFAFRLSDGGATSGDGAVTLDITPVNDPPSAEEDVVATLPGQPVTVDPLANDWDRDGDPVQFGWCYRARRGSVLLNADGSLVYTPGSDFQRGADAFAYVIQDPSGLMATGTVTIRVGHLQGGDWNTFARGPAHTGYYPGRLGSERFLATWSIPYSNSATMNLGEVVIGEDLAIFPELYHVSPEVGSNHLVALDLNNGREVWSLPLPIAYFYPPTYDRGSVYLVQDTPHVLWCVAARTGLVNWTNRLWSTPAAAIAPTVAAGGVWFRSGNGRMLAGFGADGAFRFETWVGGYSWDPYWTASYYQDVVYCWNLYDLKALHPLTGELLWELAVNPYAPSFVTVAPAVEDGRAFLNMREQLVAVDLAARRPAWTNVGEYIGTPAVHEGVVYITTTNRVQAFRTSDGALIRDYGSFADGHHQYTSASLCPILTDDLLISAARSNTYVFDRNGAALLQALPAGGSLALAHGTLLIASGDVKLRAFTVPIAEDLLLTAEAPPKATIWNPVNHLFTVRNSGPSPATGVQLAYRIPASCHFVSAHLSQGGCQRSGDEVRCDLGTLEARTQATVAFEVVPISLGWLAGEASVTRAEPEANPKNNQATASSEIELPHLSVHGFSYPEGDSGLTLANLQLWLSATSALPVSLSYQASSASARSGLDFLAATGTVVILPGTTDQTIPLTILADTEYELDEQFIVYLGNITNAAESSFYLPITILNDDPAPVISIGSVALTEPNVGQTDAVFSVTLSKTSSVPASVFLQTSNVTAEGGVDYGSNSLWLAFAPGVRTVAFRVPVYGDVRIEPDEMFAVYLGDPQNATLGNAFGLCTILNDDGRPGYVDHFSFGTLPAAIGVNLPFPAALTALDANGEVATRFSGAATLQVLLETPSVAVGIGATNELSPLPFGPLHDNYVGYVHCELIYLAEELRGPRRLTALEFLSPPGTEFPDNLVIRLQHTPRRTFDALAWTASGWTTVLATNNAYNMPPLLQFRTPFDYNGVDHLLIEFDWKADGHWASVRPGTDTHQWRALFWSTTASYPGIPVGAPAATSVLPSIRFHGATASAILPSHPQFVNGVWSGELLVGEPLERFLLRLDDGDGHISVSPPIRMELSNDLSLRITHSEVITAGAPFDYTLAVANTGPAVSTGVIVSNIVSPNLEIVSVVASQGSCAALDGVVRCALGEIAAGGDATIHVRVVPTNTASVRIQASSGRVEPELYLRNNQVIATIDQPVRFTISDASAFEGSSLGYQYMTFVVRRSPLSSYPVSVAYGTKDLSATSVDDYIVEGGVLTFGPGESSQTISITLLQDRRSETDETFQVRLYQAVNAVLQRPVGVGTILNDDYPIVSVLTTSIVEPDDGLADALFLLNLSEPAPFSASVSFVVQGDTATAGLDFMATAGLVYFPAGETSQVVAVPIYGDRLVEADERFLFRLLSPSTNVTWTNLPVACTILDNDRVNPFRISLNYTTGVARIEFLAQSNRSYSVEFTDSLGNPAWHTLVDLAPEPTNRPAVLFDPHLTNLRFYRARTPSRP